MEGAWVLLRVSKVWGKSGCCRVNVWIMSLCAWLFSMLQYESVRTVGACLSLLGLVSGLGGMSWCYSVRLGVVG